MIVKRVVEGSKQTVCHNLDLTVHGMDLIISNGSYFRNDIEVFNNDETIYANIPIEPTTMHYELWITPTEFVLSSRADDEEFLPVENYIDRLVWFTVPANVENLNEVEITFVEVNENADETPKGL